jgi:hypothetical protein
MPTNHGFDEFFGNLYQRQTYSEVNKERDVIHYISYLSNSHWPYVTAAQSSASLDLGKNSSLQPPEQFND